MMPIITITQSDYDKLSEAEQNMLHENYNVKIIKNITPEEL